MPGFHAISRWLLISLLVAASVACDTKTAAEHLQSAHVNVAEGEPRVAIIELKNAIQKDPSLGEARSLLGQLHFLSGDLPSALKELERAVDLGIVDDTLRLTLLRTKTAMGRYTQVLGELEQAERLDPDYAVVLAEAYLAAGDFERAKPLLQQGLHLPVGLLGMAKVAQMEKDVERSYSYLLKLVQQYPQQRDGWLLKGEVELSQNNAPAALESFAQAQKLLGGDISGQLGTIRAYLLAEDLTAAQTHADALIARVSEFPPAQYLKGLISFKQNDLAAAEAALRVVQQYARDHLPTLYLMGAVKAQQGQLNQAEDNLRRYLARDSGNVSVRKLLASIYNEQSKIDAVVEVLQPVSEQNDDPQVWAMMGAAYLRTGNMAQATEAFQQAVNLAPDMAPFRNQLALSLLSIGQDQQAIAELDSAVQLDGDQFQSDYILVMLKLRDKDYASAAQAVENLIEKSAENPIGYNIKGAIALAQGDTSTATIAFERALKLDASYFPAAKNLARIAEQNSEFERAAQYFQAVLSSNADSVDATLALVDLAVRQGKTDEALLMVSDAVQRFPQSVRARLGQLRLLGLAGRLEEAERAAQAAYELAPDVPDVLLIKAEIDLRSGDRNEAQKMASRLQTLIEQFKNNSAVLAAAGSLQLRLGNLTIARSNLELAEQGTKVPAGARVSMARLELLEGNAAAAQAQIDQLRAQGVDGEEIDLLQGDTFIAAGKAEQAKAHFRAMADAGSRRGTSRYSLVVLQQGDFAEAQRSLRAWLASHPEDRGFKVLLANAQIQAGQSDDAKIQYEAMLPTKDPVVLNNLAWIYFAQGDERALEMARQANTAAPKNPDIEDTLGWILVQQGTVREGLDLLRSSARARPDNATVQYHLGVAYRENSDVEAAKRALQRALSLGEFTESPDAEQALANL